MVALPNCSQTINPSAKRDMLLVGGYAECEPGNLKHEKCAMGDKKFQLTGLFLFFSFFSHFFEKETFCSSK